MKRISVVCAALISLAATATSAHADPSGYSAQPRASWSPNGAVYALAESGGRVYLGGNFTAITNRATGETVEVTRLAAIDAVTGDLIRTWTPAANNIVYSLVASADGTRIFAGGTFTSVSGVGKSRLAALNATTGALIPTWGPYPNAQVRGMTRIGDTLYLGGLFTSVSTVARTRLAAVSATTGTLLPWAPAADASVSTLEGVPDGSEVVIGGTFHQLGGVGRDFLGAVDAVTGTPTSWNPTEACGDCQILDVAVDDTRVYAGVGGTGGHATAWNRNSNAVLWSQQGDGDVESIAVSDGMVYAGGHYSPSFAGTTRYALTALDDATGAVDPYFAPQITQTLGTHAILAGPSYLRIGGTFQTINGTSRARYAEFPIAGPPQTLLGPGTSWRYDDSGADLGTAWSGTAYDDSAWPSGAAQLGFGDGDEATALTPGRITYYFRTTFTVANPAALRDAVVQLVRDDGAIVHLNGTEIFRTAMPAGAVTSSTPASSTSGGADESFWHSSWFRPSLLRNGLNTLAVEVHQAAANSSDVSFNLQLTGR
ncbi:hypothetical protein [Actinocorallia longicatena]